MYSLFHNFLQNLYCNPQLRSLSFLLQKTEVIGLVIEAISKFKEF